MDLYLLRHAHALPRETPGCPADSLRPLTIKGRRQVRRLSQVVKLLDLRFDLVLASPWLRAQQTASGLLSRAGLNLEPISAPGLAANRDPERFLPMLMNLNPAPDSLLIVGHEPFLGNLASLMVSNSAGFILDFSKGALCRLEITAWKPRPKAKLKWLLTQPVMISLGCE